jgi:hypothetical protein
MTTLVPNQGLITRRSILVGAAASLLCAPAIVRVKNLMPVVALPYELDQIWERADICVGTDPFHTPPSVRDAIIATAEGEGYSVAVDVPFAGALVPLSYYGKDRRVLSVMIEVNRRLYMDEHSGLKTAEAAIASGGVGDALR